MFGYYYDRGYLSVQIFFIRGGKIVERHFKIFPTIDEVDEELTRYIAKFYTKNVLIPKEILVPSIVDSNLLQEFLNTKVVVPQKGIKYNLIETASVNAKIKIEEEYELIKKDENKTLGANEELRNILKLDKLDRIEMFDNSNLFGNFNVSGMVVFINGSPNKNEYRKFKIMEQ